ncbi:DEAD/DEAH box helicase family protein [Paraclostridium bifermentans]|uniref:DEAD/DEAH box helicase family protein n=2 Tax=Paraclostridium bifermentans TaxID=1490 RepID=UPI001C80DB50|nr:DEAD/DEAH box helicase family protein [Paraclostridium bifermentans]GIM32046.1 hypothetical protein PAGU1678_13160 [Paraclostridium bifermentans subsp. muricolitidis]
MSKREFLSDVIKQKNLQRVDNLINLIVAPCGCGKTTYINKVVLKEPRFENKITLFIVDTNMLEDQLISVEGYEKFRDESQLNNPGVYICTYHRLGKMLALEEVTKKSNSMLEKVDLLVCDEAHNLVRYANIARNGINKVTDSNHDIILKNKAQSYACGCSYLLMNLTDLKDKLKHLHIIMLTATPDRISSSDWFKGRVYSVLKGYELKGYRERETRSYPHFKNISEIKGKALVYVSQIEIVLKMKEHFEEQGYTVGYLWSKNNGKYPITEEQKGWRAHILMAEDMPPGLDILIVNEAYETGWNLKDKDVQTVIVHTTASDSVIQARGRVRSDIELLYVKQNKDESTISMVKVPDEYLNRTLTTDDLKEMCLKMNLRDNKGRVAGWRKLKQIIIDERHYSINSKRTRINGKQVTATVVSKNIQE